MNNELHLHYIRSPWFRAKETPPILKQFPFTPFEALKHVRHAWTRLIQTERVLIPFPSSFHHLMHLKMCSDFQNRELEVKFIPISKPTAASQDSEDFQCGICSASFNSKSNLLEHVLLRHGKNKKSQHKQQNQSKIELKSCSGCATKFRNDFDLYKHRRHGCQQFQQVEQNVPENLIQENELQQQTAFHLCSECGLTFKFRIQLLKHQKLHDKPKEIPPENSLVVPNGSRKSTKSERKTVDVKKSFSCPKSGCDFRTRYRGNIANHLKSKHGDGGELFKCDLCPFTTVLKWNLKQHERTHFQQKPFACSFRNCDFRSRWVGNLRAHQARHENNKQGQGCHQTFHPWKKSTKGLTSKPSQDASECGKESEKSVGKPRALSRQRSQAHNSLCEELLIQDFPQLPAVSSNLKEEPRISEPIPRENSTDETDMTPPLAALAPKQAQNKSKKLKNKAIKTAGLKRKPIANAIGFQCPRCPYSCKSQWLLGGHLVDHGAAEPYYCPMAVPVPPAVKPSRSGTEGTKPRQPTTAPKSTENVVSKYRKDPKSNMFLCTFADCGFKTRYEFNLLRHAKLHRIRSFSYTCPKCHRKFANGPALGWHKRSCGRQAKRPPSPAAQTSSSSGSKSFRVERQNGRTMYICTVPDCNFQTRFRPSLLVHQQSHEKYGVFAHACANCPRKYATVGALRRHEPKCARILAADQAVPESSSLKSTRIIPIGQTAKTDKSSPSSSDDKHKSYTCAVADCNYKTRFRGSFMRHRASHDKHGIFAHSCAGCRRKFPTAPALSVHGRKCPAATIPANQDSGKSSRSTVVPKISQVKHQWFGRWYTCSVPDCNYKTHLRARFNLHRQRHKKYGKFEHNCAGCQRKFATLAAHSRHRHHCTGVPSQTSMPSGSSAPKNLRIQQQRTGRWYTCVVADCNFSTLYAGHMWHHKRSHLKYGSFAHTCADCQRKFATAKALACHRNRKTAGRCSILWQGKQQCHDANARHAQEKAEPQRANAQEAPKLQASAGTSSKTLKCPDCPYETTIKSYLKRHSVIHLATARYACPYCTHTSSYSWNLKIHLRRRHPNKALLLRMPTKLTGKRPRANKVSTYEDDGKLSKLSKKRSCASKASPNDDDAESDCSALAPKTATANDESSALSRHGSICPKTANFSGHASAVRRLNKGKAFTCGHGSCKFHAKTLKNLRIHEGMAHRTLGGGRAGSKPQSSSQAQTTIIGQDLSRLQVSVGSKGNELKCLYCPYQAKTKWFLNRHSIMHTGERPFSCPLCPYTGRFSWNLKDHQQRHHRGSKVSPASKLYRKTSCARKASNNDHAESDTSELAHNTDAPSDENTAPGGCTFCSYMSRLGKYLTKHMTAKCPGCHKSTNQNQPQVPSSTLPQVRLSTPPQVPSSTLATTSQVPSQSSPSLPGEVPNFGCMLCGYVAASESQALDHSRMHKTAVVALERL